MPQSKPAADEPGGPPSRRGRSAATWLFGFGLCGLPVFLGILNHDVAWFLHAAGRILSGQRLYVDVVEINPPLIVWLNLGPVLLARSLDLSTILSFRLIMLGVLAGSLLLARWILAREHPGRPALHRQVLIPAMIALVALAGADFGQREHLMLALVFPYLLLASARAKGRPIGPGLAWIVGLAAGVGIALKPHFLLPWVAIEADLAWGRRGWHARPRPEAVAVAAVGLTYAVAVMLFVPEYASMLRWAMPVYARCAQASVSTMIGEPATLITAIAALAYAAVRPQGDHRERCRLLMIATVSLLAIAFIQDKGFPYHFYPALATGLILIGLIPAGWSEAGGHPSKLVIPLTRGILAVLVLAISASRVQECRIWRGNPGESDTTAGRMIRLEEELVHSGSVFTFSAGVGPSFPSITYSRVGWASRHPCLWFLAAFHPDGVPAGSLIAGRTPPVMDEPEQSLRESVVSDLIRARPTLLFVDEPEDNPAFGGRRFDFLEYYQIDPRFAEFLRHYERITRLDRFDVYRRDDPKVAIRTYPQDE